MYDKDTDINGKYNKIIFGDAGDFDKEWLNYFLDIVNKNVNNRRIKVLLLNGILPNKLKEKNYDVTTKVNALEEVHPSKHYVIIWGRYDADIEGKLRNGVWQEIDDYIYREPKPIYITGNVNYYKDARSNEIWNMKNNIKITLYGYGNKIRLPNNISATNINIHAKNASKLEIKEGAKFLGNTEMYLWDMAKLYVGKSSFGENTRIVENMKASIIIGDYCTFGRNNGFAANAFHTIKLGDDLLTSFNISFQCGDGHSIFDLSEKRKMNYEKKYSTQQSIVLGNHIWIGQNVIVLRNTIIGSGSYISAHSFVRGRYRNNTLIAGNPAKERRDNRAWHRSPFATYSQMETLYSLKSTRLSDELLGFNRIMDLRSYCAYLHNKPNIICVISVKDIVGSYLQNKEQEALSLIGVDSSLVGVGWRGFVFVSDGGKKIFECLTEDESIVESTGEINGKSMHIISAPLHKGNKAVVEWDGRNYATSYKRGFNFVLFDKRSMQLIDSVEFDTHVINHPCYRKIFYV